MSPFDHAVYQLDQLDISAIRNGHHDDDRPRVEAIRSWVRQAAALLWAERARLTGQPGAPAPTMTVAQINLLLGPARPPNPGPNCCEGSPT